MDRREFVRRAALAAVFGAVGVFSVAEAIAVLREPNQESVTLLGTATQSLSSQSQSRQTPVGYVLVTPVSALAGKTSAFFNHPTKGESILVNSGNQWRAFSAICTHAGCTVQYTGSAIYCPCHSGYFSPTDGSVQGGPPPSPLLEMAVLVQNGNLYVSR